MNDGPNDQNLVNINPLQLAYEKLKPEESLILPSPAQQTEQQTPRVSSVERHESPTLFNFPEVQSS